MSAAAQEKIDGVQATAENWSAEEVVRWGFAEFAPDAAIASSFGAEDVALIDIASRVRPDIRVFTLDTDFLFAETYELIVAALAKLLSAAERAGVVRPGLDPDDVILALAGLWEIDPASDWKTRARRLYDLVFTGLKA